MTKTDNDFADIDIQRARNSINKPKWINGKDVIGFDTETTEGDVFLLTVAYPGHKSKDALAYEPDDRTFTATELFDILTKNRFRNSLNIWFNIGFDAEVILKNLPNDKLAEINVSGSVEWNGYDITYLQGKFLSIDDGNGNSYDYYDIAESLHGSLDSNVSSWLDDSYKKNQQDIDTSRFDSWDYIQDNYERIYEYAKNDAYITQELADKVFSTAEGLGIPCGKPFSSGYLAEQFLTAKFEEKPGFSLSDIQRQFWESYHGGRFEIFERGNVGEIVGPDINSAYPAVMSELPDPASLEWSFYDDGCTLDELRQHDYGVCKITVTTDANRRIQPFMVSGSSGSVFPALENCTLWCLKETLEFAVEQDYVEDLTIHSASAGDKVEWTRYPFNFIPDKYDERKTFAENGNQSGDSAIKLVLNSMYGKTIQTTMKVSDVGAESVPDDDSKKLAVDYTTGLPYIESQQAGNFFNPFIASYTTGMTRLNLHKAVVESGLESDTVMFATDCIMVKKDAYEQSDFDSKFMADHDEPYADQLGKWDFDYEGDAFVIGSGVYEVARPDGSIKTKSRGYGSLPNGKLKELAAEHPNGIPVETSSPVSIAAAMDSSNIDMATVGKFINSEKLLKGSADSNRNWPNDDVTYNQLVDDSQYGEPLVKSDETFEKAN